MSDRTINLINHLITATIFGAVIVKSGTSQAAHFYAGVIVGGLSYALYRPIK